VTTLAVRDRDAAPGDNAAHLLIVDDDERIRTLLGRYLKREGFRISMARDAAEARARMAGLAFDLLIVDVMMPGESGLDFVADLRHTSGTPDGVPVLMLTARGNASDRIDGLEAGADDYLAKPFEPRELTLRIRSVLRRSRGAPARRTEIEPAPPARVGFGAFAFHLARGELRGSRGAVRITERERDILRQLAEARGATLSREALATPSGTSDRTIDVQVTRLRRKIEADPAVPLHLQTVRGIGYRLVTDWLETAPAQETQP
jgi:two-component system phosphate regulon response regulator OmpR